METGKLIDILLIEDNIGDITLTKKTLSKSKIMNNLTIIQDGDEAIEYLSKKGKHSEATTPDVILLDLNLPKKSGQEILNEIKSNELTRHIPVVVLTTSKKEEDILRSYNLHANCFVSKPIDLNQFQEVVSTIEDFWFTIVKLPPKNAQ